MVSSTTTKWLTKRPKWLQVAVKRLLDYGDLSDAAISDLAIIYQKEANNEFPNIDCIISIARSVGLNPLDAADSEKIISTDGDL